MGISRNNSFNNNIYGVKCTFNGPEPYKQAILETTCTGNRLEYPLMTTQIGFKHSFNNIKRAFTLTTTYIGVNNMIRVDNIYREATTCSGFGQHTQGDFLKIINSFNI